jgi:hypothetical protein
MFFLQIICCWVLSVCWIFVAVVHSKLSSGICPVLGRGCYFLFLHHMWYPGTVFKGICIGLNGEIPVLCLMLSGVLTMKSLKNVPFSFSIYVCLSVCLPACLPVCNNLWTTTDFHEIWFWGFADMFRCIQFYLHLWSVRACCLK